MIKCFPVFPRKLKFGEIKEEKKNGTNEIPFPLMLKL